ncbi:MAG TPA: CYTH domain-containing protein [Candidatus Paceibacterota bacterium]|jgi:adenylate cyclase class 2|nr:CYTH domain-containing protein [Candidatus Paceibacterota bacterium]
MEEFEIKFLEVDVAASEKKLLEIGAEKIGEFDYIRTIFYLTNEHEDDSKGWIRVRTDGRETTLTFKKNITQKSEDGSMKNVGMNEIEVIVDDYEKTCELMKAMGLIVNKTEKNRRIRYTKGDVAFDIDFWPQLPPYLEIESDSYEKVKNAARELGFHSEQGMIGTAGSVYKKYGFNVDDYSSITFESMIKR